LRPHYPLACGPSGTTPGATGTPLTKSRRTSTVRQVHGYTRICIAKRETLGTPDTGTGARGNPNAATVSTRNGSKSPRRWWGRPDRASLRWPASLNIASERGQVSKARLEAFSDGVIAIIITIMVLELRPPAGFDL